jgi:hypothetical protein
MRMNAGKFNVNHEIGREYLSRLGSFRPAIGAVFALLMYFTLRGHLLPNITAPSPEHEPSEAFAWFLAVGFFLGFSERLAKEMVSTAESGIGFGGGGGGSDGGVPPYPGLPPTSGAHSTSAAGPSSVGETTGRARPRRRSA